MTSGGTLAAGFARVVPSFAAAAPPSTSGVLSLAVTFPLLTGNWRRASSSASRIWRAFSLQAMATTTAATAAAPSPNQTATAGGLAPWGGDSNMSSIKTYDRTIRDPVRYIRPERVPPPAPAAADPPRPARPARHRAGAQKMAAETSGNHAFSSPRHEFGGARKYKLFGGGQR